MRLNQNTTAKSNRRSLELKTKSFILTTENIILMTGFFTFSGRYETTDKCMRRFIINIFSKSPDKPVRRPHNVSTMFKKLQIAEVRDEQSQATLWIAVKTLRSSRTPCGVVYFEHAQIKRHGLAFAKRIRLAVGSSRAPLAWCKHAFKYCI